MHYLAREGYAVPADVLGARRHQPVAASDALQEVLIEVYRTDAKNAEFCERLVDLDEGLQEWRYRHVKMVAAHDRHQPGTGGSSGAELLVDDADAAAVSRSLGDSRAALSGVVTNRTVVR